MGHPKQTSDNKDKWPEHMIRIGTEFHNKSIFKTGKEKKRGGGGHQPTKKRNTHYYSSTKIRIQKELRTANTNTTKETEMSNY
jgi:hypothetical protein